MHHWRKYSGVEKIGGEKIGKPNNKKNLVFQYFLFFYTIVYAMEKIQ
jgi:hypothetical protein